MERILSGVVFNVPTFDYAVRACGNLNQSANIYLDTNLCHAAAGCPPAKLARQRKHDGISKTIASLAREAGMEARLEPDTYGLLLGDVPKEICKHLFPRTPPGVYRQQFADLAAAQAQLTQVSTVAQRDAAVKEVKQALQALPESTELRGLRVDVAIHDPATGADHWVDTSTVHTSSLAYLPAELNALKARRQAALVAAQQHSPDPLEFQPSPSVIKREQEKIAKYAILTTMAQKQITEHKRQTAPVLHPFVLTDNGEFGPAADALQEVIVEAYKRQPYHRLDGITLAQRASRRGP